LVTEIEDPDLMTASEVAKLFRVTHQTVIDWVNKDKLDAIITPGGRYRFRRNEVMHAHAQAKKNGRL
jgi:excisionase family DNA binding protein